MLGKLIFSASLFLLIVVPVIAVNNAYVQGDVSCDHFLWILWVTGCHIDDTQIIQFIPDLNGTGPAGANGSNGTNGVNGTSPDYSKIAYVNQSNAFVANNTFIGIFDTGWLNVSNSSQLGNLTIQSANITMIRGNISILGGRNTLQLSNISITAGEGDPNLEGDLTRLYIQNQQPSGASTGTTMLNVIPHGYDTGRANAANLRFWRTDFFQDSTNFDALEWRGRQDVNKFEFYQIQGGVCADPTVSAKNCYGTMSFGIASSDPTFDILNSPQGNLLVYKPTEIQSVLTVDSHILPNLDANSNLGSASFRMNNVYSGSFWGRSLNGTYLNATYVNSTQDVNTSRLFVGNNRSAFPVSCSGTNKISGLDANGFLACSADVTGTSDYSKLAYVNQSNGFTANNTFQNVGITGWLNVSNSTMLGNTSITGPLNISGPVNISSDVNITAGLNVSSYFFVGLNRSVFPFTCSGTNKVSGLSSAGFLTCSADVSGGSVDYSKLAYVNQSNAFTANNTFQDVFISGWLNVSNGTTLGNTTFTSSINQTAGTFFLLNLNVSNITTVGNGTASFWNISQQLFVGQNRSAFPLTCLNGQAVTSLGTTGLFACQSFQNTAFDSTNECLLNATQTFTGPHTVNNNWIINGWLNVSNSTTFGNVTFTSGINQTNGTFNLLNLNVSNITVLGNTSIRGDLNVSNLTVLGTTFVNNYPAVSMIFDNETEDVLVMNKSFKSFTLPANNFSRIIIEADYELDGASGSLYSWILEFRNSTAIWKDVNFTDSALTGLQQRFGGMYSASANQQLSSKLNVTFFPITAGSAIVGINSLRIYGVS